MPHTAALLAHDDLPCGWLRLGPRGEILGINRTLCQWLAAPREALLLRSLDRLLTPASRVLFQSHLQPLLKLHGNVEEFSLSLQHDNGPRVDMLLYAEPHPERHGGAIDLVLVRIRQRRRIEDEMLRIKRAADLAPGLIFQMIQSPDGSRRFPYTSEAIRRFYGVTSDDAARDASVIFDRIEAADRATVREQLAHATATLSDCRATYRVVLTDGAMHWHELLARPRQLAGGVILWHGHVADVTQRKEIELSIAARESVERSHRLRNEFLARVSHELRTPLNGILGFAQLLAQDHADNLRADQSERIRVIRSSGSLLLHLINEVLEISSLEAGQLAVDVHSVMLRPCLETAIRSVTVQAEAAGITLQPLMCPPELSVKGNEQRLLQVLGNLLTNAIKYNRTGGSVSVRTEVEADWVRIAVTDTGWGMTPEQRANLFQPFNRLGAERSGVAGTGLGLVITQNLLQLMGGRIEVRSQPGRGATFTASLALCASAGHSASATHRATHRADETAADAAATRGSDTPQSAHGVVLYVEDNEVNAVLMQAIAGMRPGLRLHVAADGASALLTAPSLRPDLMLIDLDLPDIDGQSLLAQLRQSPTLTTVPAVMVSATPPAHDKGSLVDAGFIDHWLKPLDIDRVLNALDRLLGRAD